MNEPRTLPIVAPESYPKRDLVRAVLEIIASSNPVTDALSRLYQNTHPSKGAQSRAAWEQDITGRTNEHSVRLDEHDEILTPRPKALTEAELHILVAIAYADQDGLGDELLDIEDLAEYIPAMSAEKMDATIYDLVIKGLINELDIIGSRSIRATQLLFETFDAQVMGWSTEADAVELAKLMLANPQHDTPSLAEKTEWPLRRINPAVRYLMNAFPDWLWRDDFGQPYPSYGLIIDRQEKSGLQRFIADHEKAVTA